MLCYKAYQLSPCGWRGSTDPRCVDEGLVADISLWWEALPYALGGLSELFINVPAYGIAYSRAPINMRGLVSAINLASTAIAQIVNLAATAAITDPHLVWDFGAIAILGAITTVWFVSGPTPCNPPTLQPPPFLFLSLLPSFSEACAHIQNSTGSSATSTRKSTSSRRRRSTRARARAPSSRRTT